MTVLQSPWPADNNQLSQLMAWYHSREEAASGCELHSNADILAGDKHLLELYDMRVPQHPVIQDLCLDISAVHQGFF